MEKKDYGPDVAGPGVVERLLGSSYSPDQLRFLEEAYEAVPEETKSRYCLVASPPKTLTLAEVGDMLYRAIPPGWNAGPSFADVSSSLFSCAEGESVSFGGWLAFRESFPGHQTWEDQCKRAREDDESIPGIVTALYVLGVYYSRTEQEAENTFGTRDMYRTSTSCLHEGVRSQLCVNFSGWVHVSLGFFPDFPSKNYMHLTTPNKS